jgi:hypothetical protein
MHMTTHPSDESDNPMNDPILTCPHCGNEMCCNELPAELVKLAGDRGWYRAKLRNQLINEARNDNTPTTNQG